MSMEVQVHFYRATGDHEVIDKMEVDARETVGEVKQKLMAYYGLVDEPSDPYRLGTSSNLSPADATPLGNLDVKTGGVLILRQSSISLPTVSPATGILLTIREGTSRKIVLGPTDARHLDVDQGDLLRLSDPMSGISVVGKVEINAVLDQGMAEMDQMMIDSLGSSEDMEVKAERFDALKLKSIRGVTFGIRPIGGMRESDAVLHIRQREKELLRFMDKTVIVKGQKLRWDEEGVLIYIVDTQPSLMSDEVALISNEILGEFKYQPWGVEPNFDGILLIDMSFSMNIKDMPVRSMDQAIKYLGSGFDDAMTTGFLSNFKDGKRCRRMEGAVLAAIMYLAGKVGRGKGERVSIILFSTEATSIEFNGAPFYDASLGREMGGIASSIISTVQGVEKLGTNMAEGLEAALRVIQQMSRDKMKMIVLLTDGFPDDEGRVREVVDHMIAPRSDIVLFAAGVGQEVNQRFMSSITVPTGGEFLQVESLDELAEWYSNLARKLEFKGRR